VVSGLVDVAPVGLLTRPDWLELRRSGIGSSDAPIVAGCHGSLLQLWLDKVGLLTDDPPPTEEMEWGIALEPVIAEMYCRRTGETFRDEQRFVRHPNMSWMTATLDRVTHHGGTVELKAVGLYGPGSKLGADEDNDSLPEEWIIQATHQMIVAGSPDHTIAAFGPGLRLRIYHPPFDEDLAAVLTRLEREFWHDHVLARVPPEDFAPGDAAAIAQAYRGDTGEYLVLDGPVADSVVQYHALGGSIRYLENERAIHKARILLALGDASGAELRDGWEVRRKVIATKEHLVKACTQVRLTVKAPRIDEGLSP
jgi:putative phage-type endonuclease